MEARDTRVHTEYAAVDIGEDIGALLIYCRAELLGQQIEISLRGYEWQRVHTDVLERRASQRPVFAALFQALTAGDYVIWGNSPEPIGEVTIVGGQIAKVNWCHLWPGVLMPSGDALLPLQSAPARYRQGKAVCAAPMGSAPLRYDERGQVAWDCVWTDFCDLALAGGPPHRGTLLEPATPEQIHADQGNYQSVVNEIERGLSLVTGLPVRESRSPGWVEVSCEDEEMALWLLRAILVENVCTRREGHHLLLPAGPAFRLEKEIKNVITVLAKTYHYWTEHTRR